jgi:hypothetical protein
VSEAQKVISVLEKVFGDSELPLCMAVMDKEGLELYSTRNCSADEVASINVLAIDAFDGLTASLKGRVKANIDTMLFRSEEKEYFVAPVGKTLYLCAISAIGKMTHVIPLLDGLRAQTKYELSKLDQ